jgi:hypothetical protein
MQSGYPLAISQPNNNSVIGASAQRPNATGVGAAVDAAELVGEDSASLPPDRANQVAVVDVGRVRRLSAAGDLSVSHPALGTMEIFLVPVGPAQGWRGYHATFA